MSQLLFCVFFWAGFSHAQTVRAPVGKVGALPVVLPAGGFSLSPVGPSLGQASALPGMSVPALAPVLPGSPLNSLRLPKRLRTVPAVSPSAQLAPEAVPALSPSRFSRPSQALRVLSRSIAPDLRQLSPGSALPAERSFGIGGSILDKILGVFAVGRGSEDSAAVDRAARKLLLTLLRHQDDPLAAEAEVLKQLAQAHQAGMLEPLFVSVLKDPRIAPMLPQMPEGAGEVYAKRLAKIAGAELEGAGMIPGVDPVEKWKARGKRQMGLVNDSAFERRKAGESSLLLEEDFIIEMEALTGDRFTSGNRIRAMGDGARAYAERSRLISGARRNIDLMAWALYDDKAGQATADLLIAKRKKGVQVRVIVDGQTVADAGHGRQVLARLEAAGVEVIRFHDSAREYDGLHAKMMIIDGRIAVAGGRNVGDPYLHADPDGHRWRDMDVVYEGPAVAQSLRLFARLFNEQVFAQGLGYEPMAAPRAAAASGAARAMVSYQRPGERSKVLLGMLKAISGASTRINIENAYFITFPAIRQALMEALERGVEVNILTNSAESVDEAIVIVPILESLPELIEAGAKVYLKQGDTLHAKFMTVDGVYSNVTSFNLHPRSDRYEHEMSVSALDAGLAAELDAEYAADILAARPILRGEDLIIPRSALTFIVSRYLFNQL